MARREKPEPHDHSAAAGGGWAADLPHAAAVVLMVAVFVVLLGLLWFAIHILLLVFGGILFAIFLRALADGVAWLTRLGPTLSLVVVAVGLFGLVLGGGVLLAPYVAEQLDALSRLIPEALDDLREGIEEYEWGRFIVEAARTFNLEEAPAELWLGAFGALGWGVALVTGAVVIFFIGIYLAVEPSLYVRGVVRLAPLAYRDRLEELLGRLGNTLRWWLIGQAISMVFIAVIASTGLWLMGVPLAPVLGMLSGLLTFMPTFGPILGAVLPLLLALSIDPMLALYVLIFYIVLENFEGYVLSPMIQQRAVQLPKALAISFQLLMLILVGPLGLVFGHPLAASTMVAVQQLYVRDTLGDQTVMSG